LAHKAYEQLPREKKALLDGLDGCLRGRPFSIPSLAEYDKITQVSLSQQLDHFCMLGVPFNGTWGTVQWNRGYRSMELGETVQWNIRTFVLYKSSHIYNRPKSPKDVSASTTVQGLSKRAFG